MNLKRGYNGYIKYLSVLEMNNLIIRVRADE